MSTACCGNLNVAPTQPLNACPAIPCQESNVQTYIQQNLLATISVENSWNIAPCGGSSILSVPGLKNVLVGSYLWSTAWGYFQIIAFNPSNGQLTVQNNCTDGNAAVGSQVPACSNFVVTPPPFSESGGGTPSLFPFVAIDFTAPANGVCIDITVTTVNGLSVGKNVQIGSGMYRVGGIPSGTILNICNDGTGITPGTPVIAKNAGGDYQYPAILIDANPCTNAAVLTGALLVCKEGISQPLDGTVAGQVPVLTNPETNEVTFQLLDVPTRTCSSITCCLVLTPGVSLYTIPVGDSSQFVVGDILQIGTRSDRFTVTAILDATHVQGTLDPVPSTLTEIAPGTSLCVVDCCEILEAALQTGSSTYGGTSTGGTNAYIVALNPPVTAYTPGQMVSFNAHQENTGSTTLDAGAGPVTIRKFDGSVTTVGSDIIAGGLVVVQMDESGTMWILQQPSNRILTHRITTSTIASSAAETSIFGFNVPAGLMGAGRALRFQMRGRIRNQTGGTEQVAIRLNFGGTTLVAAVFSGVANSTNRSEFTVEGFLTNKGATNVQDAFMRIESFDSDSTLGTAQIGSEYLGGRNAGTIDTTVAQLFEITAQLSVSSSSFELNIDAGVLELL